MKTRGDVWEVIPFVPLPAKAPQSFSYRSPEPSGGKPNDGTRLAPGMLVRIPLGSRNVPGLAWKPSREHYPRSRLKSITRILSTVPLFTALELSELKNLATLSLTTFTLLAKTASLVRSPLKTASRTTALSLRPLRRLTRRLLVRWATLADVLPHKLAGQVLVLAPEAVLAHEALRVLEQRGIPASLFAQTLPAPRRRAVVEQLARGEPRAVVTTHAGVFLPFPALAEIIVVEAALPSHRQWDLHPRYDARVASVLLADTHRAPLTFQSTLPSLDLHCLQPYEFPTASAHITVSPRSPADPLLPPALLDAVRAAVETGGTVLLFHDIVGTERVFACATCGSILHCQACAGILERSNALLRCRACGASAGRAPQFCPRCKSPHLGPRRIGTEKLAEQLRRAFPGASILRADRETLPRTRPGTAAPLPKGSIVLGTERVFAILESATFDQIVVVDADRVLENVSFDAAERFAALVCRIARFAKPDSNLLLQTTYPHLPVVRALAERKLEAWMTDELADRKLLRYPPYDALLHLQKSFPASPPAASTAKKLVSKIRTCNAQLAIGYRVAGTSPRVRAEISLRGSLANLQDILSDIPSGWSTDPQIPLSLLR